MAASPEMLRVLPFLVLGVVACTPPAPVGVRGTEMPRDTASQCTNLCGSIGLPLDSVVVMANNVGCVCRAATPQPPGGTPTASGPAAGGMAAIMLQEEEEAQRSAAANQSKKR